MREDGGLRHIRSWPRDPGTTRDAGRSSVLSMWSCGRGRCPMRGYLSRCAAARYSLRSFRHMSENASFDPGHPRRPAGEWPSGRHLPQDHSKVAVAGHEFPKSIDDRPFFCTSGRSRTHASHPAGLLNSPDTCRDGLAGAGGAAPPSAPRVNTRTGHPWICSI